MCKSKYLMVTSLLSILILTLIGAGQAQPQEKYPTRPIDIIVPFSPGGATDLVNRVMAVYLNKKWGVPVNVVNKPGGNSIPATVEVYNAAPNGYTMLGDNQATSSMLAAAVKNLPFKMMDRTYIAMDSTSPMVLFVTLSSPFKSLDDLIAEAKKNPGNISYTSLGGSGGLEYAVRQLFNAIGVDVSKTKAIMCQGGSQAVTLTAGGHVTLGSATVASVIPAIKGGSVRPLLVTSKTRYPDLPDLPTSAELGYPMVTSTHWNAISGPPKLPPSVAEIWDKAIQEMLKDPAFVSQLKNVGAIPFYLDAQGTREYVLKEIEEASKLYR